MRAVDLSQAGNTCHARQHLPTLRLAKQNRLVLSDAYDTLAVRHPAIYVYDLNLRRSVARVPAMAYLILLCCVLPSKLRTVLCLPRARQATWPYLCSSG